MRYAIIIEKAPGNYSAYSPDLPGCAATGRTIEEVTHQMSEAVAFHIEGLRLAGEPVPKPTSLCAYVEPETVEATAEHAGTEP